MGESSVERKSFPIRVYPCLSVVRLPIPGSKDQGVTWSTLEPTALPAFASPPYLRKLRDGRLALLWNPPAGKATAAYEEARRVGGPVPLGPRQRLALATSSDGGRTWVEPHTLTEDGVNGYCYPWMVERNDGTLLVFCSRTPYTIYPCDLVMLAPTKP